MGYCVSFARARRLGVLPRRLCGGGNSGERASEDGILGLLPCIRLGAAAAKRATSAVAARRVVDAYCGMATVTEMKCGRRGGEAPRERGAKS